MKKYIVYRHSSKTTGKVYIGITCQNPIKRWGAGNNYKGCFHFYSAILKYGWDDFEHRKGIKYSEHTLSKMSKSHLGKHLSEQAKSKLSKSIIQMDLDGNVIAKWKSIAEVCRTFGYTRSKISECCHNRRILRGKVIGKPTAYGYKWKFEDDLTL